MIRDYLLLNPPAHDDPCWRQYVHTSHDNCPGIQARSAIELAIELMERAA